MSEYQYEKVNNFREAKKTLLNFLRNLYEPLNNSFYANKIILVGKNNAKIQLINETYGVLKRKNYKIFDNLEENDDFTKELLSKPISKDSDNMKVFLFDELPNCNYCNAFIIDFD